MATKKQKRLAGEAKAARQAEERRRSGLAAQQRDHAMREAKLARAKEEGERLQRQYEAKIRRAMAREGISKIEGGTSG